MQGFEQYYFLDYVFPSHTNHIPTRLSLSIKTFSSFFVLKKITFYYFSAFVFTKAFRFGGPYFYTTSVLYLSSCAIVQFYKLFLISINDFIG